MRLALIFSDRTVHVPADCGLRELPAIYYAIRSTEGIKLDRQFDKKAAMMIFRGTVNEYIDGKQDQTAVYVERVLSSQGNEIV